MLAENVRPEDLHNQCHMHYSRAASFIHNEVFRALAPDILQPKMAQFNMQQGVPAEVGLEPCKLMGFIVWRERSCSTTSLR